jgi:hypothetical protein
VPDPAPPPRGFFRRAAGVRAAVFGSKAAIEVAVNILLPWLVYRELAPHYGDFIGLAASAAPPTLWSLYELARFRKLDALSLIVLAGILLSLLALAFGGSPRLLMVRENLFTIPIGLAFLLSILSRRPLIYYLASAIMARQSPARRAQFEAAWQRPHVLRGLRIMSLAWGIGLTGQGVLLGWLAWTWPIERYLLLSPIIGYGIIGALSLWSFLYQQAMRRASLRGVGA